MPAIFGCLNRDGQPVREDTAIAMVNSIKHQNPRNEKWVLESCLLGKTELLDRDFEKNFFYDRNKPLLCILMGRIYNQKEIALKFGVDDYEDDASLIAQLYEKNGFKFAGDLNGSFAAAIYDGIRDRVIVLNDRHGFFPLFYSLDPEKFSFGSELKVLLTDASVSKDIDKTAISEFFMFKFLLNDRTFFTHAKYLRPAHILIYDRTNDKLSLECYWSPTLKPKTDKPMETYLSEFRKLMEKSIERRVRDKKKIGVFLSGGLDSRLITAYTNKNNTELITFTFGVEGCQQQKIAKEVAERLGVENIFLEIPSDFIARYASLIVHEGDGLVRIRDCHFISLLESISKKVDTILLGMAGGELFGQTILPKIFKLEKKEELVDYIFQTRTAHSSDAYSKIFVESFPEINQTVKQDFQQTFNDINFPSIVDVAHYWEIVHYLPRYIYQAFQYYNWYIEARHPFLDNDLVDFAFNLPSHFKLNESFLQKALKTQFPTLADIPWEYTGVPPDSNLIQTYYGKGKILMRNKLDGTVERLTTGKIHKKPLDYRGYSYWLRTGSKDYVRHILIESRIKQNEFLNNEYVKQIVEEHMKGERDHGTLICDLLNLELANREFFSKQGKN
ncbi:MAG: asparagine synthase-related protein [Candidatus Bathyarchaeota archaeon]|nr:asparagine synthase-related protein [Candidatus Bathyarchaeota archaeon]